MKLTLKTVLVIMATIFRCHTFGQWNPMTVGTCQHISSIHCPTENTCYIIGWYGYMRKSTDQGGTWTPLNTGTTKNLTSCFFTDSVTGYVCGADGFIMKTTDGGVSWVTLFTPDSTTNWFWSVVFTDSLTGYLAGDNSGFYKTINGGTSWTKINVSNGGSLQHLQFVNDSVGYMATGATGLIKKTVNRGISWQNINIPGFSSNVTALHFPSSDYGYAVSGTGQCSRTNDASVTWDSVTNVTTNNIVWDCFFVDSIKGFCVTNKGLIYYTLNGGQYWGMSAWPTSNILSSIYFQNKTTGYALGWYNSAFKYGGTVGTELNLLNKNHYFEVFPNPLINSGIINVDCSQFQSITICDLQGQIIQTYSCTGKNTIHFDRNELNNGMYLIQATYHNGTMETKKLIVQ